MSRRDKMFYYPKPQLKDLIMGFAASNSMSRSEASNLFAREFFSKMTPAERANLIRIAQQPDNDSC